MTTAVELNIFSTLAKNPCTVAELAKQLQVQERGLLALLPALAALNYVAEKAGRDHNSQMAHRTRDH